jgi:two-component system, OmpR family, sensor histidine kinase KdpD
MTSLFGGRTSTVRAVVAAVVAPTAATGLALLVRPNTAAVGATIYLLAVVIAAAVGGTRAGLVASAIGFLGLNFFFTAPRHTFRVGKSEDLIALIAFLVVAVTVGSLLARALADRERAARGERDARLLGYLSTKLLSGEPLERVMNDFAQTLLEPFGLASCEIRARLEEDTVLARAEVPGRSSGPTETVPLTLGDVELGTMVVARSEGERPITPRDRALLEAAAKQAAVALERARMDGHVRRAQLEAEANRLRASLFSSVTHDLRTPLASIKAGATSLLDDQAVHDRQQQRELLTTILEETDRLNRLVGNIMDLARIRAGALRPSLDLVAIDEVVEAVLARMRPTLAGFDVKTVIRSDLPEASLDPVQIDQVLTNLLENAARHSPDGGRITVSVSRFRDAVQVRVGDQGPGIPPEERERVFDAFYRGSDAPDSSGRGLGLAIAHAIVQAHGGRIWIEGTPGSGTTVVFEIPLETDAVASERRT